MCEAFIFYWSSNHLLLIDIFSVIGHFLLIYQSHSELYLILDSCDCLSSYEILILRKFLI